MYAVELSASLIMIIHGLLLFAMKDHFGSARMLDISTKATKVFFVLYAIQVVIRMIIYIKVEINLNSFSKSE
jgi:hypothetical protein